MPVLMSPFCYGAFRDADQPGLSGLTTIQLTAQLTSPAVARLARPLHRERDERPPAGLVQHLGALAAHARALAGREDDGGERPGVLIPPERPRKSSKSPAESPPRASW